MKMEGSFVVPAPRAEVWEKIRDAALMASCIPGCRKIEMLSPNRYRAEVGITVGPVKADFNLVVEISKEEPPRSSGKRAMNWLGARRTSACTARYLPAGKRRTITATIRTHRGASGSCMSSTALPPD